MIYKLARQFAIAAMTVFAVAVSGVQAQERDYDEKIVVGDNLFKVRSNNVWGLVDSDGTPLVSVRYNEPLFMNGWAVITQPKTGQLVGVADDGGFLHPYEGEPVTVNPSFPFVCDGLLAVYNLKKQKWGYYDVLGRRFIKVKIRPHKGKSTFGDRLRKTLGLKGGIDGQFELDFAAPFIESAAVVFSEKTGWSHIDMEGNECLLDEDDNPNYLRTSLNNSHFIAGNADGVVECMPSPNGTSGVIFKIDDLGDVIQKVVLKRDGATHRMVLGNGAYLKLNSRFQAEKYVKADGDSIVFIEPTKPKPVVAEPVDSFTLSRDIMVTVDRLSVPATANGVATIVVKIGNKGNFDCPKLDVNVETSGVEKSWSGPLEKGATKEISLTVPARFSTATISRILKLTITSGPDLVEAQEKITIRRYKRQR